MKYSKESFGVVLLRHATPSLSIRRNRILKQARVRYFSMWSPKKWDFANDDGKPFLIAAWHELFYGFTPDTFQPRLHNVASLVDELVYIAKVWGYDSRNAAHLKRIQAELSSAIKGEDKILSLIPTYRTSASALVSANSSQAIVAEGDLIAEQRDSYWKAFETWAKLSIEKLPSCKKNALEAIRRLATFAFQHGKEDDDVWDDDLENFPGSTCELFDELIARTQKADRDYLCTLSLLGEIDEMHSIVRKQGHKVVSDASLPLDYRKSISAPGEKRLHVQLIVPGSSIRHAVATARKKLGLAVGFAGLYKNSAELRLHSIALISLGGGNRVLVQTEQAFRRLFPRKNARKDINNSLHLVNSHEIDRRVLAAVEQLALATASTDTRTRLISLWSALETLAGSHEGSNTIERVSALIVPLVVSRQVHKSTRYMTILCEQLAAAEGERNFGSGFREPAENMERRIWLEDMLCTLTAVANDPKIKDLFAFAKHPLVRFHIYSTWKIFQSPTDLRNQLLDSQSRVEWQLARIYRARNLLVHEGLEVPHIVPLLDNLQNYTSMLVQRLVHELKSHSNWTVRHAIGYWNSRMHHITDSLGKCSKCLTVNDFLETDELTPLWPDLR